VWLEKHI